MLTLTKASWQKMKKSKAKNLDVPETGLTNALKAYDKKRKALDKKKTSKTLDAARTGFDDLMLVVSSAKEALGDSTDEDNPFRPLRRALDDETKPSMIRTEGEWFQEIADELEEQALMAAAATEEEALYEKEFLAFTKIRSKDPQRSWFPEMVDAINRLDALAEQIIESDAHHLAPKYAKQRKILAKMRADVGDQAEAYIDALRRCIAVREALLVDMRACTQTLAGLKGELDDQLDRDPSEADDIRAEVSRLREAAEAAFGPPSDEFAPNAPIRSSSDVRAAGLHTADVAEYIGPHLTALIQANKPNLAAIKEIRELADSIEAWLPAV